MEFLFGVPFASLGCQVDPIRTHSGVSTCILLKVSLAVANTFERDIVIITVFSNWIFKNITSKWGKFFDDPGRN